MASKSNRSQHDDLHRQQQDAQALMSEQARHQLVLASEVSSVMCRAAEAVQQIQQHMTQRAALRYQQMAEQMRQASSPGEFMALQSTLVTAGLQEVAQYMQDMTAATLRIQSMLIDQRRTQEGAAMAGQAASAAMNAWQTAMGVHSGMGPSATH